MNKNNLIKAIKIKYIDNLNYPKGSKLPTARELMDEFDVSSATLIKAFDILESEKLIKRITGSGVFIEKKDTKPKYIGLVGLSSDYEIMVSYINGVDKACKNLGFSLMLGNFYNGWNIDLERKEILSLIDKGCQGIVLIPTGRNKKNIEKDYLNTELFNFPIVLLDTGSPKLKRIQITYNYEKEAYDLTKYFLDLGYKKIFFFHNDLSDATFTPTYFRYKGFIKAMKEANLSQNHSIRPVGENSFNKIKEFIKDNSPEVIIFKDDLEAKTFTDFLRLENIQNIKLAGFDNLTQTSSYPFVTTDIDEFAAAEFSVEVLLKLMTGEYDNNMIFIINSKIIVR